MRCQKLQKNPRLIPSVEKSFKLLEFLASQKGGYTITELSRKFKIPISTMNNLLLTLVYCGYLRRDGKGMFRVTMKLLDEAAKVMANTDIRDAAHEDLEALAVETGLAAILSIRDGDQIVCIDKEEGASQIRVASNVGMHYHIHSTATGKAVLANLSDEEVDAIVERTGPPAVTPHTITSVGKLRKELARIRESGYALDNEENTPGIRGVAAPVLDHNGKVGGGVNRRRRFPGGRSHGGSDLGCPAVRTIGLRKARVLQARGSHVVKITEIKSAGLRGETPEGGWSNEIKPDDCVHTLIAVSLMRASQAGAACSPAMNWCGDRFPRCVRSTVGRMRSNPSA